MKVGSQPAYSPCRLDAAGSVRWSALLLPGLIPRARYLGASWDTSFTRPQRQSSTCALMAGNALIRRRRSTASGGMDLALRSACTPRDELMRDRSSTRAVRPPDPPAGGREGQPEDRRPRGRGGAAP